MRVIKDIMMSDGKVVNPEDIDEYFIESRHDHHNLICKYKDGTTAKAGGFNSKESANIALAKSVLGMPSAARIFWSFVPSEDSIELPY